MGTSERTFNQVKAILNKLDRAVDEARQRRTTPPSVPVAPASVQPTNVPPAVSGSGPSGSVGPGGGTAGGGVATSSPASPAASGKPGSAYGRAQPLRPGAPPATSRWQPPGGQR